MRYLYLGILSLFFYSCRSFFQQPHSIQNAKIGELTSVTKEFDNLPKPKDRIAAAVYKFRDQTGQYKASDLGANWSTAIPQGTTSMLLKSLEDSGWFLSVERENVSNLMNERKIIRSSMAQYQSTEQIPAMIYANVILEGGIVSYDANIITGGSGLRYFGSGGSTQYRQDRFTVYLRAVASRTGQVLKTVYTSKTVLSQSVSAGVFRYVSLSHLLEGEVGLTTNEPIQIALQEAIDKSVQMLILEGIKDKLWVSDENEKEKEAVAIAKYDREEQQSLTKDIFGVVEGYDSRGFSVSPLLNYSSLNSDYSRTNSIGYGLGVNYRYNQSKNELQFSVLSNRFRIYKDLDPFVQLNLINTWSFQPNQRLNISAGGGFGAIYSQKSNSIADAQRFVPNIIGNMGMEYFVNKRISLRLSSSFLWNLTDNLDGLKNGKHNDNMWSSSLGVNYFLRGKK